ncbi:hypothetical protein B0T09DRAFT_97827 [Sordaria sp. MPI-SDFR-AT-0083]|nr:hypothetical protein B0T09DRAFT_97827 [Sordaria sp. MPI-SDFR-AT-0083]
MTVDSPSDAGVVLHAKDPIPLAISAEWSAGQDTNSGGQIGGGWVIEGLDGSLLAQSHFHEGCPSRCCRSL